MSNTQRGESRKDKEQREIRLRQLRRAKIAERQAWLATYVSIEVHRDLR